jgi:hypothetical protein
MTQCKMLANRANDSRKEEVQKRDVHICIDFRRFLFEKLIDYDFVERELFSVERSIV